MCFWCLLKSPEAKEDRLVEREEEEEEEEYEEDNRIMDVGPAGEDIKNTWCTASYVTVSTVWSYTIIIYIIFLHHYLNNIQIISKHFHRKSYKEQVQWRKHRSCNWLLVINISVCCLAPQIWCDAENENWHQDEYLQIKNHSSCSCTARGDNR